MKLYSHKVLYSYNNVDKLFKSQFPTLSLTKQIIIKKNCGMKLKYCIICGRPVFFDSITKDYINISCHYCLLYFDISNCDNKNLIILVLFIKSLNFLKRTKENIKIMKYFDLTNKEIDKIFAFRRMIL